MIGKLEAPSDCVQVRGSLSVSRDSPAVKGDTDAFAEIFYEDIKKMGALLPQVRFSDPGPSQLPCCH